ncbi:MAG: WYL domain-containing protein [Bacilli bacterium]|nr:WYL domain-containing protein [Bacilli bacterium]
MYRDNSGNLVTLRLSKIIGVSFASDRFSFSKEETEKLEEMIRLGAQFSEYGTYEMKAKFTKEGLVKLHLAYKNRPLIMKEEGSIVTFRTNDFASMIYFTQFGEMMTIIEPDDLREKILDFHRKAIANDMGL